MFQHYRRCSGYLTRKELESCLTLSGEPFSADEMEEMWTAIKGLRITAPTAAGPDGSAPPDAFDYSLYTKFMMK